MNTGVSTEVWTQSVRSATFLTRQAGAVETPLAKTVAAFLRDIALADGSGGGGSGAPVLLVSLSGGVDSMVLTHLLLALRPALGPYEVRAD